MDAKEFLDIYEKIVKGEISDSLVEQTFADLFERIEGTYLEEDFSKCEDKISKLMVIDKFAHFIHSKDPDLLSFSFPEADTQFVKDTLDRLSGLESVSPVRKASRGYFTTFASTDGLEFLQKQVGSLKKTRASREEIKEDVAEYERLFKAGIASHAELLTLSRYYGDKGQRFLDEVQKKSFTADDPMVVGGYASVEVVDKEGHLITTEALSKAFFRFMESFRTRNINFAHCLTGDTLVWKTHGGYTPISEIKEGDHVYTHTGKSRQVLKTLILKSCMPINVLELDNGEVIRITDEHEVFTKRGWVAAKDLHVDDVLMKTKPDGVVAGNRVACDAKRGKTLVEFYGEEKAAQMKNDISSKSSTRIRLPHSEETKRRMKESAKESWTTERKQKHSLDVSENPRGFCLKNDSDQRKGKSWVEMYGHERPNYGGNAGDKNPRWLGGIARLPYPFEFHADKKEEVRARDGHRCQRCGKTQEAEISEFSRKLTIHHVDYNKDNSDITNWVSLCNSCNGKVNFDRDYWKNYFTKILQPVLVTNGTSIRSIKKASYDGWVYNIQVDVDNSYAGKGIIYHNSDVQAGWPLRVWINNAGEIYKSGVDDKGLYLVSEVRPDITIANKVEKEIEAGIIRSYSIAGSALDKSVETKGGRVIMVVNDLELAEISFCLLSYERVWTKTGLKPIKDIISGELVLTHTLQWKPVVKTMNRHVSEDLIKITTERGELIATSEHPVRTLVYGGRNAGTHYEWLRIGDLKTGDLVSDHIPVGVCEYCGASIFVSKEGNSGEFRKHCSTECRFKAPGNRTGATLESGDPGTIRQANNHRRLHAEGYLKPWSDEDRANGEEKRLEVLHSEEFSKGCSERMKTFIKTPEGKIFQHKATMASWQAKLNNPEKLEAWFKAISGSADHYVRGVNHKKTKPEQKIVDLLKSMSLKDWKFTGDGTKSVEGKFPDFSNGDHKIIEVFGDYWHTKEEEIERIKYFNDKGYDCLVLWESQIDKDIDAVKNTVNEFVCNKLSKVISIERIPYTGLVYNIEVADDNSYVTEFATVHNCEKPVNQESNFDIIKSYPSVKILNEMITKEQVLEAFPKGEIPLSDYSVCIVGGLIHNGQSANDIDMIIRADKDSFLGRAIRLSLLKALPEQFKERVRFIFEAEGPHGDYVPLYNLRLGPVNRQEVNLEALSKAELMRDKANGQLVGMNDAELHKIGELAGANFDTIDFDEFKMGVQVELEHYDLTGMDNIKTAKIALAHIREVPDYYTKLKAVEADGIEKATKGKVEFRINEEDQTRPEDENDIAIKKEASHLRDKGGSNEQVKQSPDVQTPVTKVGEIHMSTDKGKKSKFDKLTEKWHKKYGGSPDEVPKLKGLDGLKDYVDQNVDIKKEHNLPVEKSATTYITSLDADPNKGKKHPKVKWGEGEPQSRIKVLKGQPPAMAPARPGLVFDPTSHRWIRPNVSKATEDKYSRFSAGGKHYRVGQHPDTGQYHVDVHDPEDILPNKWYGVSVGIKTPAEAHRAIKEHSGDSNIKGMDHLKKNISQDQMAGLAAFLDFVKDEMKPDLMLAFTYECPSCGDKGKVSTIGGHPTPKSWPCSKCKKEIPKTHITRLPPFPTIPDKDY